MSRLKAYSELILNFFRKPVTVKEDFGFVAENFRWLPRRNADLCTGCGACNERCSSGATSIRDTGDERLITIDSWNCIFCGRCADACPEKALELTFEPKTGDPSSGVELQGADTSKISLSHGSDEPKATTDTTLKLQHCRTCGKVMPVTEKYLDVVKERTLRNLKPETAAVIEKDMEKYLRTCIDCRRKYSLEWDTHPRKWI